MIQQYEIGGPNLRQAVEGLTRDDLLARPGPGLWSIQEVVIHLADSDAISIDRMKRMVTEDNPSLLYADETPTSNDSTATSRMWRMLCCSLRSADVSGPGCYVTCQSRPSPGRDSTTGVVL